MAKVNDSRFCSIVIDNKKYSRDILVFPDGRVEPRQGGLWMFSSHAIRRKELERLLEGEPEVVIIGTGTSNKARLSAEAENWAKERKLKLTVLPSYEAIARLNELADQGRKVAAMIHITC